MTCRHQKGDPACGSYNPQGWVKEARETIAKYDPQPVTPDSKNFEIEQVTEVGQHLVMRVRYPNCKSCGYEGNKVMVFLGVGLLAAIKWRTIDPHFRDPKVTVGPKEAPAPAARFPGSPAGWDDAVAYAKGKS